MGTNDKITLGNNSSDQYQLRTLSEESQEEYDLLRLDADHPRWLDFVRQNYTKADSFSFNFFPYEEFGIDPETLTTNNSKTCCRKAFSGAHVADQFEVCIRMCHEPKIAFYFESLLEPHRKECLI